MKHLPSSRIKMYIFLVVFIAICLFSLVSAQLAPHDPEMVNLLAAKQPPNNEFLMGTDWLGRCIWSRILAGAYSSIFASLIIVTISAIIGCGIGLISGYAGGFLDEAVMRVVDIFFAFPGIVLSIAVAGMLGPGLENGIIALAAVGWTQYARLIRSYVLSIKQENFVKAAILNGQSQSSIILNHILPNAIRPVVVTGAIHLSGAMLSISGLSFLGLGSSTAEWGSLLSEGRSLMQQCPWVVLYPALSIFLVTILFNLLGNSVRDVLNPKGYRWS